MLTIGQSQSPGQSPRKYQDYPNRRRLDRLPEEARERHAGLALRQLD